MMDPNYYLTIDREATGRNIKRLMDSKGYTVRSIQNKFGFENPQGIYKWIHGKALPSIDNLVILSGILGMPLNDILIIKNSSSEEDRRL